MCFKTKQRFISLMLLKSVLKLLLFLNLKNKTIKMSWEVCSSYFAGLRGFNRNPNIKYNYPNIDIFMYTQGYMLMLRFFQQISIFIGLENLNLLYMPYPSKYLCCKLTQRQIIKVSITNRTLCLISYIYEPIRYQ